MSQRAVAQSRLHPSVPGARPGSLVGAVRRWWAARRPAQRLERVPREDRTDAYLDRHGEPWMDARSFSWFSVR